VEELRSKKREIQLLNYVLSKYTKYDTRSVKPFKETPYKKGNYSILGVTDTEIFKLIAGKRYVNNFEYFDRASAEKFIKDYKIYAKQLIDAKIKIPKLISIEKIEISKNNYVILEVQELIKKKDIFDLLIQKKNKKNNQQILHEFHLILNALIKINNYAKKVKYYKPSIDTKPLNFLEGGIYVDLTPAKIKHGQEYNIHKKIVYKDEYSSVKLGWFYNTTQSFIYFICNFGMLRPDLIKEFLEIIFNEPKINAKKKSSIRQALLDEHLQTSLLYILQNFYKINYRAIKINAIPLIYKKFINFFK